MFTTAPSGLASVACNARLLTPPSSLLLLSNVTRLPLGSGRLAATMANSVNLPKRRPLAFECGYKLRCPNNVPS